MKKLILVLVALFAVCAVYAADTVITGVGSNYTGIGTFQVSSDGTDVTLTVDKLIVIDAISGAKSALYVTNATAATALTLQRAVNLAVTNVVLVTEVQGDYTNVVGVTLQYDAVRAVTNVTAATTLTFER